MKKRLLAIMLLISWKTFSMDVDLEKAVNMALENNRDLKTSKIETVQQNLIYKQAYKEGLPSISLESDYTDDRNSSDDGYFENGIVLTQSLYSGGEISYGIEGSKKNRELYEISYQKEKWDTRLEVVKEYINILQLKKTSEVYKASIAEKEEELKKQLEFYNLGLIDKSEILKVESSLYETQSDLLDAENNILMEKLNLKKLLGMDLDENIVLGDINLGNLNPENITLTSDVGKALEDGLEARKLSLNYEITEIEEKAAKSDFLPEVDLEYAYESSDESSFSDSADAGDWQWRVGISFEWEIFNFGSFMDSYKSAKLDTDKAEISRKDQLEDLKKNIISSYLNLKTKYNLIEVRKKDLEASKETYEIDREKYSNRLIDTADYLDTESDYREAEVNYINARLDYRETYEEYINLIQ